MRTLTVNMRVRALGDPRLEAFDNWCLSLGNGTEPVVSGEDTVRLPENLCVRIGETATSVTMSGFCDLIFPDIERNIHDSRWLEGRAILAPTNKAVDRLNELMVSKLPGEATVLLSSDVLDNPEDTFRFNTEYLNTLAPMGLPQHRLVLKPGMVLMLLRNLNPRKSLCNGTKLIFHRVLNYRVLECTISGDLDRRKVFIPRVALRPKEGDFAFEWSRRQYPVRAAFSFTINKVM